MQEVGPAIPQHFVGIDTQEFEVRLVEYSMPSTPLTQMRTGALFIRARKRASRRRSAVSISYALPDVFRDPDVKAGAPFASGMLKRCSATQTAFRPRGFRSRVGPGRLPPVVRRESRIPRERRLGSCTASASLMQTARRPSRSGSGRHQGAKEMETGLRRREARFRALMNSRPRAHLGERR